MDAVSRAEELVDHFRSCLHRTQGARMVRMLRLRMMTAFIICFSGMVVTCSDKINKNGSEPHVAQLPLQRDATDDLPDTRNLRQLNDVDELVFEHVATFDAYGRVVDEGVVGELSA